MTKKEFMRELAQRLSQIPANEKADALDYYENYFADADITDEMLVPESMGTPEKIARQIIEEIVHKEQSEDYFDENAEMKSENKEYIPYYKRGEGNFKENSYEDNAKEYTQQHTKATGTNVKSSDAKVVAIILLVITCPIWISVIFTLAAALFSVVIALISMVFAFAVAGIALIGASFMSGALSGGLLLAGTGLILCALGIVMIIPLVLFCVRFLPWLVKILAQACKKIFETGKEQA